jgi:hypothetical protein
MTAPARRAGAAGLFLGLLLIYNANGREIATIDSQPAKFAACELVLAHTLTLDRVVAEHPGLADRPSFQKDLDGHWRDAHAIAPVLLGSVTAAALGWTHLVDLRAPLTPNLVASITASLLTAGGVVLLWLAIGRLVSPRAAWVTAIGLGVGTNLWAAASRTLWGHETVTFGVALAIWAVLRPAGERARPRDLVLAGVGLALAIAARPQVAPLAGVLLLWMAAREGLRSASAWIIVAAGVGLVAWFNWRWFGSPMGAAMLLEAANPAVHATTSSFVAPWAGAAGLLLSPSRGLVVFSPIVLAGLAGVGAAWRYDRRVGLRWLMAAGAVEFVVYASYAIWWGGHTYGPRYTLDLLGPLAPVIAIGVARLLASVPGTAVTSLALAWSIVVAGAGAFIYPNDAWNTNPDEVDTHHERLWQVRDSQIPRALHSAPSPQNFNLWTRDAFRSPR